MGKYMPTGKGAGKVAVTEVSPGALRVRTRAKAVALEQGRRLASAKNVSLKPEEIQIACVVDPFQTIYLKLRSWKLEKAVKAVREIERPCSSNLVRLENLWEEGVHSPDVEATTASAVRPAAVADERFNRVEEVLLHGDIVSPSQTPKLSSERIDGLDVLVEFPVRSALSTLRATVEEAQLRNLGLAKEPLMSDGVPAARSCQQHLACVAITGEWPLMEGLLSQEGLNSRHSEAGACYDSAGVNLGICPVRRWYVRGSKASSSFKDREAVRDESRGSSIRIGDGRRDRRIANHHRIMRKRYMRTNLYNDEETIDDLFAAPDRTEREEGKRFTERYNFDVVNDVPFKGRYQWEAVSEPCSTTTSTIHEADQQRELKHDASFPFFRNCSR